MDSTLAPPAARLLIVEDEPSVRDGLATALRLDGYEVRSLDSGSRLGDELEQFRPDLVLLDVYLPDGPDGFALAETVRAQSGVPTMFLTAADAIDQRLRGFEVGADDYLVKPFSVAELLARIRAVLRRAGRLVSPTFEVRDVVIDEATRTVVRAGTTIALSDTEFDLFRTLARSPGKVFSKVQLLSLVWGFDQYDPNLVEVYISSVRRKLEAYGPRLIFTIRGQGYEVRA